LKRIVLFVLVLVLLAGSSSAQLPPFGYMGLFVDETRTSWCASGTPFYEFEMWIWCIPSERGMMCAEFAVCYPPNVIQSTITTNPDICVTLGTLATGMSACYCDCQWDWTWPFHQMLWVTDPAKTYIRLKKHPDPNITDYQFANCEPGYPTESVLLYTWRIFVNYESWEIECTGWIGTKDASWGAIKSMYNE